MNLALWRLMGRRRKSKDTIIIETVASLAGLGLACWFFLPGFHFGIQILLSVLVMTSLVIVVLWLALKVFKSTAPPPYIETAERKLEAYYQTAPAPSMLAKRPTVCQEPNPVRQASTLTISQQLRKIDWFQFEKLIEQIYRHRGYSVKRIGGANPDGGVDLIIESTAEKFVVQCKHWRKWTVGVRQIREFLGTLTDSKISKGIFITLNGYSEDAKKLADKHGIRMLNESDVIKMLEDSGLMKAKEVTALFSDARKFCPKCENEMVLRTTRSTGNQFWGCSDFPKCRFILKFDQAS
jgi:restriction system protein